MIHIPEERENMSNKQLRELVLEIADKINEREPGPFAYGDIEAIETIEAQAGMDKFNYAPSSNYHDVPKERKWTKHEKPGYLKNRVGIQWKIDQLSDIQKEEIMIDDPTLLKSNQLKEDNETPEA